MYFHQLKKTSNFFKPIHTVVEHLILKLHFLYTFVECLKIVKFRKIWIFFLRISLFLEKQTMKILFYNNKYLSLKWALESLEFMSIYQTVSTLSGGQ